MKPKCLLKLRSLPFSVDSHQTSDLVALSNIDGNILLLSTDPKPKKLKTLNTHTESCRVVLFVGDQLVSISSDKSIALTDVEKRKVVRRFEDAHDHALYSLCDVRENVLATGDDGGVIKLWDLRKGDGEAAVMTEPEHDNFISALAVDSSGSTLLATSGDGRLSAWNSRQRKLIARSDECDSELLTCDVVRGGSKVVCGDGEGVVNVFSWGDWGDITDRIPVQSEVSVDVILPFSDDVILMGCMDGIIRATTLFPHRPLPPVGDHKRSPVEGLCLHQDSLLSIGHDQCLRVWDMGVFEDQLEAMREEEDDSDSDGEEKKRKKKKARHVTVEDMKKQQSAEFFDDL
eukprot:sb/3466343/